MQITIGRTILKSAPAVLFAFEEEKSAAGLPRQERLLAAAREEGFKAKPCSTALLHPAGASPSKQVILVGLGKRKDYTAETLRRAAAAGAKRAAALERSGASLLLPGVLNAGLEAGAAAEGSWLSAYRFAKYKSENKKAGPLKEISLVTARKSEEEAKRAARTARILSEATAFVRDLVNEPPSELPPRRLVEAASEIAGKGSAAGISITVFDKEKLEEMKMGALLGVNRGSAEPPALVHLHYKPAREAKKSVALVGKGITFDSGGLSLKPAESMETMKMDMAGAASILGVFKALAALKPSVEVHGILALTENMPGGRAYKPGDILRSMSGKSIEVLNTDAEGRVILSDALSYAARQPVDEIIDIATLTGACIIALGGLVAGAMGNSEELYRGIEKASEKSGEKFWRLPLVEEYREGLKSPIADIKNISSVRKEAGSIIGGLFLEEFVNKKPWLHLDIAGPAWSDKEFHYLSPGGTGFPTRTLIHYLLSL